MASAGAADRLAGGDSESPLRRLLGRALAMITIRTSLLGPLCLLLALCATAPAVQGASASEELVERTSLTIERLLIDPELSELPGFITRARAVLIIPQLIKGGFILGGEGGSGVLLAKGADGSWSPPAFYTLAAGSIGLQIGGQVSEVVFTLMSDGAIDAVLKNEFKLGVDASIAVGPIGKGVEASTTTNLDADIYAFSKVVGLFGGGAFEGAGIFPREEWNRQYYQSAATPRQIIIDRKFFNPHADRLRNALPTPQ